MGAKSSGESSSSGQGTSFGVTPVNLGPTPQAGLLGNIIAGQQFGAGSQKLSQAEQLARQDLAPFRDIGTRALDQLAATVGLAPRQVQPQQAQFSIDPALQGAIGALQSARGAAISFGEDPTPQTAPAILAPISSFFAQNAGAAPTDPGQLSLFNEISDTLRNIETAGGGVDFIRRSDAGLRPEQQGLQQAQQQGGGGGGKTGAFGMQFARPGGGQQERDLNPPPDIEKTFAPVGIQSEGGRTGNIEAGAWSSLKTLTKALTAPFVRGAMGGEFTQGDPNAPDFISNLFDPSGRGRIETALNQLRQQAADQPLGEVQTIQPDIPIQGQGADGQGGFDQFLQQQPGFQFRLAEGQRALERSAASRGLLQSGRAMRGIEEFAQGTASQEFGRVQDRLAQLAGFGQQASSQTAQGALNTGLSQFQGQAGLGQLQSGNLLASNRNIGFATNESQQTSQSDSSQSSKGGAGGIGKLIGGLL